MKARFSKNWFNNISYRKLIITAAIMIVAVFLSLLKDSFWFDDLNKTIIGHYGLTLLRESILFFIALYYIYKWKIQKRDFTIPLFKNKIACFDVVAVLLFLSFDFVSNQISTSGEGLTIWDNFTYLAYSLSVGIFEELYFRVLIFSLLLYSFQGKKYVYLKSIIGTSVIFGLAHIINYFTKDYHIYSSIIQILAGIGLGILFQTILLRFKNIILVIVLHGLFDYLGVYKRFLYFYKNLNVNEVSSNYPFEVFLQSLLTISVLLIVFVLPISYLLYRSFLKKNRLKNPN